jgi:hypothetical protein
MLTFFKNLWSSLFGSEKTESVIVPIGKIEEKTGEVKFVIPVSEVSEEKAKETISQLISDYKEEVKFEEKTSEGIEIRLAEVSNEKVTAKEIKSISKKKPTLKKEEVEAKEAKPKTRRPSKKKKKTE